MALWLVRAGRHGEYELRFLKESRFYLTWDGLDRDLETLPAKDDLREMLQDVYPDFSKRKLVNHAGQIWAFSHRIKPGDWIVLPSKLKPAIHIAEATGPYQFDAKAESPFYHFREVKWIEQDIPRSNFAQDILYSFGAFMTVCKIGRNNAEQRVRGMAKNAWKSPKTPPLGGAPKTPDKEGGGEGEADDLLDLEQVARDQIGQLILSKFKGHGMARLVEAILQAQGYVTHRSSEGPDKGIDILAAPAPMGFGTPRICIQVKSGDSPLDRPTLDQLIGAMQNVQAQQGLFVSWGGFNMAALLSPCPSSSLASASV